MLQLKDNRAYMLKIAVFNLSPGLAVPFGWRKHKRRVACAWIVLPVGIPANALDASVGVLTNRIEVE
ncbi:hypothetical protein [Sphingobacterium spiritivorum]|uniref:hypothetical protein n=1 Tax=Sphingobacterium spiritivorum TaxID=258 RepID=UPI003DA4BCF7